MRERVQEILMEIGIPANLKGFKYILDIMELFEEDEAWRNAKMMIVYEKVARMNKTNYCRVEKSIRYAFSNAVTYGDLTLVEKYLSVVNVTNGNLLHTLYARVSEEQREEQKANQSEKDCARHDTYEKEVNTFFIRIMCELMEFRNKCIGEEADHLYESMRETFGKVAGF
nr:sporulation initiation factor Spo0A C-terminal domain-containing protein [uncultured Faecalimonas sp.]